MRQGAKDQGPETRVAHAARVFSPLPFCGRGAGGEGRSSKDQNGV